MQVHARLTGLVYIEAESCSPESVTVKLRLDHRKFRGIGCQLLRRHHTSFGSASPSD